MAGDKQQLVDEAMMEKMSVAPPDAEAEAPGGEERQPKQGTGGTDSGVADEDPLSAHPT